MEPKAKDQWQNRMEIRSETSDRIYVVAQKVSDGTWGCSCPGYKSRRICKHLREMNLPTATPSSTATTPRRPAKPRKTDSDFADSKKHYDVTKGFGSRTEWRNLAEKMAAGRGGLTKTVAPMTPSMSSRLAADLAILGLTALPADADILLAAMQKRGEDLHDPVSGSSDEFWKMFSAFERLTAHYDKV